MYIRSPLKCIILIYYIQERNGIHMWVKVKRRSRALAECLSFAINAVASGGVRWASAADFYHFSPCALRHFPVTLVAPTVPPCQEKLSFYVVPWSHLLLVGCFITLTQTHTNSNVFLKYVMFLSVIARLFSLFKCFQKWNICINIILFISLISTIYITT